MTNENGTRPNCSKVKVKVDLLGNFPQKIKVVEEDDETGREETKWIKIRYDYLQKYYKTCSK